VEKEARAGQVIEKKPFSTVSSPRLLAAEFLFHFGDCNIHGGFSKWWEKSAVRASVSVPAVGLKEHAEWQNRAPNGNSKVTNHLYYRDSFCPYLHLFRFSI
jgi:hypothetical protein